MTQPVWPVQFSGSKPASFSGRNGLPAFPKMLSTKSRLLTRLPGAKNRISIDLSGVKPGTSGQTIGSKSSETKQPACLLCSEVNGRLHTSVGGANASWSIQPATRFATLTLSSGTGDPPSATWKKPTVVRRSFLGVGRTPALTRSEERRVEEDSTCGWGPDQSRAKPHGARVNVRVVG